MKKLLLCISLIPFFNLTSKAQSALDAIRFAQYNPANTARIHAVGGANTSLGGDLSAAYINPAGLAQFKTNEFVLTPGFQSQRIRSDYNDSSFKERRNVVNNGLWGVVISSPSEWKSSRIKNKTLSLSLNQTANFNGDFFYRGRNNLSSYSEKWIEELTTNEVNNFDDALSGFPTGSSLAVENYLVDSIKSGNQITGYRTNANASLMPLNQTFLYQRRGGIQEATIGMAWNRNEKFLYGFSIGLPYADFRIRSTVTEQDASGNNDNDFKDFRYYESVSTRGFGINARMGIIIKPVEYFRIGLAFHTPTAFSFTERIGATLNTDIENYARKVTGDNNRSSSFQLSASDIIGEETYNYNYQLTTPWRASVSASYVFRETKDVTRQKAFITADLELINYKSMSYSVSSDPMFNSPGDSYFRTINRDIDALYRYALNARIGGELKFKTWMVRAGFNVIGSPYQKSALPDGIKANSITPSLGIGYRNKGIFADLTASHTIGNDVHFPYILSGNNYPYAAQRNNGTQIIATIGFKF